MDECNEFETSEPGNINSNEAEETVVKCEIVNAIVQRAKGVNLYLTLKGGRKGRIHISEISDTVANGTMPLTTFKRGQDLKVRILKKTTMKSDGGFVVSRRHLRSTVFSCSLRESVLASNDPTTYKRSFNIGDTVTGYVVGYTDYNVLMVLDKNEMGRINVRNLSRKIWDVKHVKKSFKKLHAYNVTIVGKDQNYYELSIIKYEDIKAGAVVVGTCLSFKRNVGFLLKLPLDYIGTVHLTDISDEYKHAFNFETQYPKHTIVRCSIFSVNAATKTLIVSLRDSRVKKLKYCKSVVDKEYEWDDFHTHMELRGFVTCVTNVKLFVTVSKTVTAVCPLTSELPFHLKTIGACVRIRITNVNQEEQQLIANILVTEEDIAMESTIMIPAESYGFPRDTSLDLTKKNSAERSKGPENSILIEDYSVEQISENKELSHLQLSTGFIWDVNTIPTEKTNDDSSDDESDIKLAPKRRKQARYFEEKSEEERLRKTELMLLDSSREPETADDFDRLVLGSPNSSIIWLKYMAFHLQSTEIDKARAVAERALKTILFCEEQEKLNVWIALLNLENLYGTKESMQKVFQRALQYNDPLKVYKHVANIYIQSDKKDEAENLYSIMIKKFSTDADIWISYGVFLMKDGQIQSAHKLMDRSMKSVPKKDHLTVISKFAQLEFKYGDAQRANTLFESMLASYPKRTDIWSVYVDVLTKTGHIDKARDIYHKALTTAAACKKMKFFFSKYIEFEKQHGSEEDVNYAKEKLMECDHINSNKFYI